MKEIFKPKQKKEKRFHIRMTLETWGKIQKLVKKYRTTSTDAITTLISIGLKQLKEE